MDFAQFDSRKAAETPRPLHLKHPATGDLLYDVDAKGKPDKGKPCRVLLYGVESSIGQKAILDGQRSRMEKDKADEPKGLADIQALNAKELVPFFAGFENVNCGDRPAEAPRDVEWFLNLQIGGTDRLAPSFYEQVRVFIQRRANFLGNGSAS